MRQKFHASKQDISTAGREIVPSSYFPNLGFIYILDFLKNKFRCSLVLPYFFPSRALCTSFHGTTCCTSSFEISAEPWLHCYQRPSEYHMIPFLSSFQSLIPIPLWGNHFFLMPKKEGRATACLEPTVFLIRHSPPLLPNQRPWPCRRDLPTSGFSIAVVWGPEQPGSHLEGAQWLRNPNLPVGTSSYTTVYSSPTQRYAFRS